jgi:hypothetical protein
VSGTVFDGSYESSRILKSIFRPLIPPLSLMYWKYAFSAVGMILYVDAKPVSGNVPPILIVVALMPGSACRAPDAPVTNTAARTAIPASTAGTLPFLPIRPSLRMVTPWKIQVRIMTPSDPI